MAAPPDITVGDMTGQWVMNKTLSDNVDAMLTLQGVGWFTRKAIGLATVTLDIEQYQAPPEGAPDTDAPVTHVDVKQTATGGIKGSTEYRSFDWVLRARDDPVFGHCSGQTRWASLPAASDLTPPLSAEDAAFFNEGWLDTDNEKKGPGGERFMESYVINEERKWTARQIWGFAEVNGERRFTRKVISWRIGGEEVRRVTLVFDFLGKGT